MRNLLHVSLAMALLLSLPATAAEWSAKKESAAPPEGVAEAIAALLEEEALVISKGGAPELSLWLVKELPLSGKPESAEKALEQVSETTLLGVARVHADRRDYRNDEMPAGVYTVRMGTRPSDGDHLGSSDYVFFGVLIPVSKDKKVENYKNHDALSEASAEETAVYHPSIISLRPDSKPDAALLSVVTPAEGHQAVRVSAAGKADGTAETIHFEIVVEGEARH